MTTRSLSYTPPEPAPWPSAALLWRHERAENFTVASRLLPARARAHLHAFYAYARLVDELGDSYQGDRLAVLDAVEEQVRITLSGAPGTVAAPVEGAIRSVRQLGLDPAPLFDLIEANRQDQTISSYQTFEDLMGYCRLSANPVGRLVLGAFGAATPENVTRSDLICTGLQLVEHWQDAAEDAADGRVYLPQEDLHRFAVDPLELAAQPPASRRLRTLMAFEVWRARCFLDDGAGLIARLSGRSRVAVAGFWAGGHAALDAIAGHDFDVLGGPPPPSSRRVAALTCAALLRSGGRREAA